MNDNEYQSESVNHSVYSQPGQQPKAPAAPATDEKLEEAERVDSWTETGADVDPSPVTEDGNEELAESPDGDIRDEDASVATVVDRDPDIITRKKEASPLEI